MLYNDAESVTKDLEAQGHKTVKLISKLTGDDAADDRIYEVSVRGPLDEAQMTKVESIAFALGATVEEREHGNVRIS